ncbi:MAG: EAL domain-containing protein [Chloroflexi bacterium]|nr:EAL domain-containing protein [Chloroflexota bacterium]
MATRATDNVVTPSSVGVANSDVPGGAGIVGQPVMIDPSCGMAVDPVRAISHSQDGQLWCFCSRGCRDEFLGLGRVPEERRAAELVGRILDAPELLRPVFQPIVSIDTDRLAGYEALARFGAVPLQTTEAWFGLADTAGLRVQLEALAIHRALRTAGKGPPPAGTFLSLNVSPLFLDDRRLEAALGHPVIAPERLVLELTEREQVADYAALRQALSPYRARGFRVAVDDAGAGYASLRHITELGPEFIKLDARLISGLNGDRARQALVKAMASFAIETGAQLIAEGVESQDDLKLLRGATRSLLVQGYAVGRPRESWANAGDSAGSRGGHDERLGA